MNCAGDSDRALEEQLHALEKSFGTDARQLLTAIVALAETQIKKGRRAEVKPVIDRLVAFRDDHAEVTSLSVVSSYVSVASECLREKRRDVAADLLKKCIPLLWEILEVQRNNQAAIFTIEASRSLSQGHLGVAKNLCLNALISLSPGKGDEYAPYRSPSDAPFHPPTGHRTGSLRTDNVQVPVPAQYAEIIEQFDAQVRKLPSAVRATPTNPLSPRTRRAHTMHLYSFSVIYPAQSDDLRRRTVHFTSYFASDSKVYPPNEHPTHMFASTWADRFDSDGQVTSTEILAGTAKSQTFSKIPPGPFTRRAEFDAAEFLALTLTWRTTHEDVPLQYVEEANVQSKRGHTLPSIVAGPPIGSEWMTTEVPNDFLKKFDDFLFDARFHRKFNFFLPVLNLLLEQLGFKIKRKFPF